MLWSIFTSLNQEVVGTKCLWCFGRRLMINIIDLDDAILRWCLARIPILMLRLRGSLLLDELDVLILLLLELNELLQALLLQH